MFIPCGEQATLAQLSAEKINEKLKGTQKPGIVFCKRQGDPIGRIFAQRAIAYFGN
jgi:hypothetical protein